MWRGDPPSKEGRPVRGMAPAWIGGNGPAISGPQATRMRPPRLVAARLDMVPRGRGRIWRRRSVMARPVLPEDKAVVERVTKVLPAIKPVHTPVRTEELAWRNAQPRVRTPITIVPADEPGVLALLPRRLQRRSKVSILAMWLLSLFVIASALQAATPATVVEVQQPLAAAGAWLASHPGSAPPNGPWAAAAGATDILGIGGGAGPAVHAPGSAGLPVKSPTPSGGAGSTAGSGVSPAPFAPWPPSNPFMAVPAHPSFAVRQPADGFYWWAFGQCTWWAQYKRRDENLTKMGNAMYWPSSAARRGYRTGTAPAPNATVVFQPGVQGAGGAGHIAHVEVVYPGGWFLASEMNFYWNGGGWGRVDYRYAHAGPGVAFIY